MKNKEWKRGSRGFYWTPKYDKPLCLQSKQYNFDLKGVTWVYYSERDARKLLKFLKGVFNETQKI